MSVHGPTVSVLMPVFNSARFLREAVDSILTQTYQDLELIVVDDGSTDPSPEILQAYARNDPRVRLITQRNLGVAGALNAGLGIARGLYVARMDADDVSLPDRLERQVNYLQAHPDIAVVGAQAVCIDENGHELKIRERLPCDPLRLACRMVSLWVAFHPLVMFRADVVRSLGGYRNICPGQDADLWLRIARHAPMANMKDVLLKYRVHGQSITRTRQPFERQDVYPDHTEGLFGIPADMARRLYARRMFFFVLPWVLRSARTIAARFNVSMPKVLLTREFIDAWLVLAWKQDPLTTLGLFVLKGIVLPADIIARLVGTPDGKAVGS